ncbi:MAG: peptidoglycan DD-metalloendopeptidase family protein, partial [Parabacteroides sp.]
IGIVIVLIAALVAAIVVLWNKNEGFRNLIIGIFDAIKTKMLEFWNKVIEVKDNIIGALDTISTFFSEKWAAIKEKTSETFNAVRDKISGAMGEAKDYAQGKLDAIKTAYEENGGGIQGVVAAGMEGIKQYYSIGYDAINALTGGKFGEMVEKAKTGMSNMIEGVRSKLTWLKDTVVTGFQGAIDFFTGLPEKFLGYGHDMIQGLIDGVADFISNAVEKIEELAQKLIDGFKEKLGIHSPSTIFFEIAKFIAEGLINGLSASNMLSFAESMADKLKDIFKNSAENITGFLKNIGNGGLDFLKNYLGLDLGGLFGSGADIGSALGWLWPSDTTNLTSGFGLRESPGGIGSTNHNGVDIGAAYGTPIYAPADGTAEIAGTYGGYGNTVKLDMGNGFETLFGHMSSVAVEVGQQVAKGQVIGYVGSTGNSTGAHIHYSIFENGQAVDPNNFYAFANGGFVDKATYGVFGEDGREVNIPLEKPNGVKLWQQAGKELGMLGQGNTENDFAEKIGTAVAKALVESGATADITFNQNFENNVSENEIARKFYNSLIKAELIPS